MVPTWQPRVTTPLDLASKWPCPRVHVDLAEHLIEHDGNAVAQNKGGTPLHRVSEWGDVYLAGND